MSWQGAAVGALGLCALEFVLTSKVAIGRLGTVSKTAGPVITRLIDPHVALFGSTPATAATATTPTTTTSSPGVLA